MQVKAFPAWRRPRVEMVPLIDMFFLLLVFFIYGVFSMRMQEGILVELPAARTAASTQGDTLTISIAADGALFVNDAPASLETLPQALREARQRFGEPLVVMNADTQARHGLVVHVLDLVRQAGLERVSFRAMPAAWAP